MLRGRPVGVVLIVLYKLVWGLAELLAGAFVHKAPAVVSAKLAQDPQDQLANWVLAHTNLQPEHLRAITLGLLAAGLINIVLAGGLWYRSWVVRDIALWVLGGAGVLALVALLSTFTLFRLSLLGIDVVIVWYLWRVMPSHLPPRRRALRAHVA